MQKVARRAGATAPAPDPVAASGEVSGDEPARRAGHSACPPPAWPAAWPPALRAFVELFERRRYWESHEALEGAWRAARSDFYKGLILLASAYVHVGRGNARGAVAQLAKAERTLEPYRPAYAGIDLDAVLGHVARARAAVERVGDATPVQLAALAPHVTLAPDPALVRGDEVELAPAASH